MFRKLTWVLSTTDPCTLPMTLSLYPPPPLIKHLYTHSSNTPLWVIVLPAFSCKFSCLLPDWTFSAPGKKVSQPVWIPSIASTNLTCRLGITPKMAVEWTLALAMSVGVWIIRQRRWWLTLASRFSSLFAAVLDFRCCRFLHRNKNSFSL